ncbi:MAG: sugar phosphate nucleotidyltransferase, partial [Candidatus Omnitrophota bacterium]
KPKGIAEALIIGEKFVKDQNVCLILGDNIFYGHNFGDLLRESVSLKEGGIIFGYYVKEPKSYGVIELDKKGQAVSIEEKPKIPKSNFAVTGLYFYDNDVFKMVKQIKPSKRGELEITSLNNEYLKKGKLKVKLLDRGYAWLDTGNCDSLIDASMFIKTIEERQGLKIGCIEEIAYRMGYINNNQLKALAKETNSNYGDYLKRICDGE